MIRDNLRNAINNSGLIVKEIAAKSEVSKRTIDKWVGKEKIEPKVIDLYKVCKALNISMEWVVEGEAGTDFIRRIIKNDPRSIQVPDRIFPIVQNLLFLDENELRGIRANVEALVATKR